MPQPSANSLFRSSVSPEGRFRVGLHRPRYTVANLREQDLTGLLGHTAGGEPVDNSVNFPPADVEVEAAKPIYEIANAFPFRGATYIDTARADAAASDPSRIGLPPPPACSMRQGLAAHLHGREFDEILADLPRAVLYALAANSTDGGELVSLAKFCSRIEHDREGHPTGLRYHKDDGGRLQPDIDDFELFETIANNPHLPDRYKEVMVLRPGVQGGSEIIGEWTGEDSHVFEYLRSNSYIPGGHFASNMANDAVRYRASELSAGDMEGLRHLHYQRTYMVLARQAGIDPKVRRKRLTAEELEELRRRILKAMDGDSDKTATLWGWNFGYDFSASGYRLHASHQMIHQQYALVAESVAASDRQTHLPTYSCGDLVADTVARYAEEYRSDFFADLLQCLRGNTRTDEKQGEAGLTVWEDDNVLLFVPKAQVSQWELQLLVTADAPAGPVGNILEADTGVRCSIDRGILAAQRILAGLNARMVTSVEFTKRIGLHNGQRLLYSFLPKLPWAMGGFSEAQLRYISGHYPEDFARRCQEIFSRTE